MEGSLTAGSRPDRLGTRGFCTQGSHHKREGYETFSDICKCA